MRFFGRPRLLPVPHAPLITAPPSPMISALVSPAAARATLRAADTRARAATIGKQAVVYWNAISTDGAATKSATAAAALENVERVFNRAADDDAARLQICSAAAHLALAQIDLFMTSSHPETKISLPLCWIGTVFAFQDFVKQLAGGTYKSRVCIDDLLELIHWPMLYVQAMNRVEMARTQRVHTLCHVTAQKASLF